MDADEEVLGGDGLTRYLRSWDGRLLTRREEVELARRRDQGDRAAYDELVTRNLRLVYSIARRWMKAGDAQGVPLDDIVQFGTIGLLRAAEKFDGARGFKFSTYATWWIKQAIDRGLERDRSIRLPTNVSSEVRAERRATQRLTHRLGRDPTVAEVAAETKLEPARVLELRLLGRPVGSLDFEFGEDARVGDSVADVDAEDADDFLERAELARQLARLDERSRRVLELRYGLGDEAPATLEEVGARLGVTRSRVGQIEQRALAQLRSRMRAA